MPSLRRIRSLARWIASTLLLLGGPEAAFAAGGLELQRVPSRSSPGAVDFFVHGARPGEQVFFKVTLEPTDEAWLGAPDTPPVIADPAGVAWFRIPADERAGDRLFYVSARVYRNERPDRSTRGGIRAESNIVRSDYVLLRDLPALYLLVESEDQRRRLMQFDPASGALAELRRGRLDADALLAVAGASVIVESERRLVRLDGGAPSTWPGQEDPIDLAVTPDRTAAVVLTRELLTDGRMLLRLRVLDAGELPLELGAIDVWSSPKRVEASIVTGDDDHRAMVWSPDGVIREVTLGAEPARGLTFLSLASDGSDGGVELLDVRVVGDRLVAVTRPRGRGESRLLVVDLLTRADPVETPLPGRALDFELAPWRGRPAAIVALEGGRVEVVSLDDATRGTIDLPGVVELADSPFAGRLYSLARKPASGRATVWQLDVEALAATLVPSLPELPWESRGLGLFGPADDCWLYLFEPRFRPSSRGTVEEDLLCCPLDAATGLPLAPPDPRPLGGLVRRVAGR
jgi:hypothetical protein